MYRVGPRLLWSEKKRDVRWKESSGRWLVSGSAAFSHGCSRQLQDKAGRRFLLNLQSNWTWPPAILCFVIFLVRLIYGPRIVFEVKWSVTSYNHIRSLLETLINPLIKWALEEGAGSLPCLALWAPQAHPCSKPDCSQVYLIKLGEHFLHQTPLKLVMTWGISHLMSHML